MRARRSVRLGARLGLATTLAIGPAGLAGQNLLAQQSTAAATYLQRYVELIHLAPVPGRTAEVRHLVLRREAGQLTLERGRLYLLSPVGGRTVGAVLIFADSTRDQLGALAFEPGEIPGSVADRVSDLIGSLPSSSARTRRRTNGGGTASVRPPTATPG